jgi:hypothetical protein
MKPSQFKSFAAFAEAYRRCYDADTARQVDNVYHRLIDEGAAEHNAHEQSEYFRELRDGAREEQIRIIQGLTDPSGTVH